VREDKLALGVVNLRASAEVVEDHRVKGLKREIEKSLKRKIRRRLATGMTI